MRRKRTKEDNDLKDQGQWKWEFDSARGCFTVFHQTSSKCVSSGPEPPGMAPAKPFFQMGTPHLYALFCRSIFIPRCALYGAEDRRGGHANTMRVTQPGKKPVAVSTCIVHYCNEYLFVCLLTRVYVTAVQPVDVYVFNVQSTSWLEIHFSAARVVTLDIIFNPPTYPN